MEKAGGSRINKCMYVFVNITHPERVNTEDACSPNMWRRNIDETEQSGINSIVFTWKYKAFRLSRNNYEVFSLDESNPQMSTKQQI